ncbi:unnamed protein product [Lampetra fluviatilis]
MGTAAVQSTDRRAGRQVARGGVELGGRLASPETRVGSVDRRALSTGPSPRGPLHGALCWRPFSPVVA